MQGMQGRQGTKGDKGIQGTKGDKGIPGTKGDRRVPQGERARGGKGVTGEVHKGEKVLRVTKGDKVLREMLDHRVGRVLRV